MVKLKRPLMYITKCIFFEGVFLMLVFGSVLKAQHAEVRAHDPEIILQDSLYYLFSTGHGISVRSSPDLVKWKREEPVFSTAPEWTSSISDDFKNHIWAPGISFQNGKYYLYYSVSSFGSNRSAIGVATNTTLHPEDPEFEWTDHGIVIESVPGRDMWNAIDPALIFDREEIPWLSFGSFWGGIKIVQLKNNLTEVADNPQSWNTIASRYRNWILSDDYAGDVMNGAIEAPFIFSREGFYYLFVSWDMCCRGEESTYKIVVGRSRNITGPYLDKTGRKMNHGGGSLVVKGNQHRWAAVGHCSVFTKADTDYLVFHGYDLEDEGRSKLIVEPLVWDEKDWPLVSLPD